MPIWLRRYHIQQITKFLDDQEKESKKHEENDTTNKIMGPNIEPSTIYNFKK